MNAKMDELMDMLQNGVDEYFRSDKYKLLLNTM